MIAWPSTADALAQVWAASMWRASWQGAVALAAAWALCRLLPRMPAGVRPWVWRLAYLKLLLALCWATPVDLPLLPAAPVPVTAAQGLEPAPLRGPVPVAVPPAPEAAPAAPPPKRATSHPVTVVMLLWMAGVGLCFVRLGSRWRRSRRLLAGCTAVEDPAVIAEAERLRRSLGIGRPVEVWVGPGPLLVGTLRPVIVLPFGLLEEGEVRLALAHELAHLRRHDLPWGWLPALAGCLFIPHPAVWLARREWLLAQEIACDALALRATGAAPAEYGAMLVRMAARPRMPDTLGYTAAGLLSAGLTLERRLQMLKHANRHTAAQVRTAAVALAALALVAGVPWRLAARAAETAAPPAAETQHAAVGPDALIKRHPATHAAVESHPLHATPRVTVAAARTSGGAPAPSPARTPRSGIRPKAARNGEVNPGYPKLLASLREKALIASVQEKALLASLYDDALARQAVAELRLQLQREGVQAGKASQAELAAEQARLMHARAMVAYYEAHRKNALEGASAGTAEASLRAAKARTEAAKSAVEAAETAHSAARARYEAGTATLSEVQAARAALAHAEARRTATEARVGQDAGGQPPAGEVEKAELEAAQMELELAQMGATAAEARYRNGVEGREALIRAHMELSRARENLARAQYQASRADAGYHNPSEGVSGATQARREVMRARAALADAELRLSRAEAAQRRRGLRPARP